MPDTISHDGHAPDDALCAMVAASRVLSLRLDLRGRVTWCGAALLGLIGWRPGEVVGRDWFELCAPVDGETRRRFAADAAAGTLAPRLEGEVVTRPGERRAVTWDVSVLRDAGGRPNGVGLIGWDVTEARHAATTLRTSEDELRQAQKMEAVGRLAGGVAHDFNNLLTVIRCSAELALGALPEEHVCRADVAQIRQTADQAAELTRQLLAFSRRQSLRLEVVPVGPLVASAAGLLRRAVPASIELVAMPSPETGRVRVDRDQIEQALLNLVANARDAMPAGGTIVLEARDEVVAEPRPHRHGILSAGAYVAIAVADDGLGMTDEVQSHLFEPFFTTKEKGRGTGLGLATVYGIVRQSQGHVLVESAPGRGTTITLYLPRVAAAATETAAPAMGGRETVLLVEDESAVRALLRRVLQRQGYTVLEARHGGDALLALEHHPEAIDLVMTDVVMPEMGGRELLDRVRALRPATKIVVMSGYGAGEFLQGNARAYGTAFLAKPFTGETVVRTVREVLDRKIA